MARFTRKTSQASPTWRNTFWICMFAGQMGKSRSQIDRAEIQQGHELLGGGNGFAAIFKGLGSRRDIGGCARNGRASRDVQYSSRGPEVRARRLCEADRVANDGPGRRCQ